MTKPNEVRSISEICTAMPQPDCNPTVPIAEMAWSAMCFMIMKPLYQPNILQTEAVA